MRQTVAGNKLTLHRYDGVDDDRKSKMARIGSIPLATKPDEIPEELIDDLTPKELRELKEYLTKEQENRAIQKLGGVTADLSDLVAAAAAGMLAAQHVIELEKTTAEFLKRLRRIGVDRKVPSVDISVT